MKKTQVFITFLLLFSGIVSFAVTATDNTSEKTEPLRITCSEDISALVAQWCTQCNHDSENLNVQLSESGQHENGSASILYGDQLTNAHKNHWKISIGRQVIVPVICNTSKSAESVCATGLSPEALTNILTGKNKDFHCYFTSEEVRQTVCSFLNLDDNTVKATVVKDKSALPELLSNNPNSIAFCTLSEVSQDDELSGNLAFVPIDRNGNGTIDHMENFYSSIKDINRAVWIGKYPGALSREIYFVSPEKPEQESEVAFAEWLLTHGQSSITNSGFSGILYPERHASLASLQTVEFVPETNNAQSQYPFLLTVLGILVLAGIILSVGISRRRKIRSIAGNGNTTIISNSLDAALMQAPAGLYYDKSHTWSFMEKTGEVRIGIDDFLQQVTGKITDVEMKKTGEQVKKGDPVVTLKQNGKQLTLFSPVSGTIKVKNNTLLNDPGKINTSPFSEGWLYLIQPANWSRDISLLDMADSYKLWIVNEYSRLKDFLADALRPLEVSGSAVYQDGGEIKAGVLEELPPKVWEEFQHVYINKNK